MQKRDKKHDQGIEISQTDIRRIMLKYPEVMTDLVFVTIPTMSPYLYYSDIDINTFSGKITTEDGAHVDVLYDVIQRRLSIVEWRQHQNNYLIFGRHQVERSIYRLYYIVFCTII